MKNLFILSIFIFAGACSFNKSSTYWNEDPVKKKLKIMRYQKLYINQMI